MDIARTKLNRLRRHCKSCRGDKKIKKKKEKDKKVGVGVEEQCSTKGISCSEDDSRDGMNPRAMIPQYPSGNKPRLPFEHVL